MFKQLLLSVMLITACGSDDHTTNRRTNPAPESELDDIRKQLLQLQEELASIATSDYANCDGALSTVAQNICKIAQAATVEVRVEMQGAITELANQLESKIADAQTDFTPSQHRGNRCMEWIFHSLWVHQHLQQQTVSLIMRMQVWSNA